MRETGYIAASCWRAGENLAWGVGEEGTVRAIFRAWMRSPLHRRNILGGYSQIGIGVEVGTSVARPKRTSGPNTSAPTATCRRLRRRDRRQAARDH